MEAGKGINESKQVTNEMNKLRDVEATLSNKLSLVFEQLQSVLRQPEKPENVATEKTIESLVPLADDIRNVRIRVQDKVSMVNDLLARLEL